MKKNSLISLAMLSLLSLTTQAETLNESLAKCTKIQDDLARLVCFDDLAKQALMSASAARQANVTVPAAKSSIAAIETTATPVAKAKVAVAPAAKKAAEFGAEHLKKSNVVEEDLQVVFTIAKLKKDQYGKWRFTFKNGQQWKQTDDKHLRVKVDESVLLKKGVMGAVYLKKHGANKKIRVKRLK